MNIIKWASAGMLIVAGFLSMEVYGQDTVPAGDKDRSTQKDMAVPEIYLAAKSGKLQQVRSLIAEGINVNASNANGRTALMGAVYFHNKSIVKELISEGVDVDAKDSAGRTALMIAVANNDIEIVELLIASGADVNITDNRENTALTMAEKSNLKKSRKKKLIKLLEKSAE